MELKALLSARIRETPLKNAVHFLVNVVSDYIPVVAGRCMSFSSKSRLFFHTFSLAAFINLTRVL
jgi:hypothetical protein